ncbi:hypothetical protein TB2_044169 [Malus domestica]
MEESLLLPKRREEEQQQKINSTTSILTWTYFFEEVKRLGCTAGPMVAVILSQNMLLIISMMMVGPLGELALSSSAIAISLSNIISFSLFGTDESSSQFTGSGTLFGKEFRGKHGIMRTSPKQVQHISSHFVQV